MTSQLRFIRHVAPYQLPRWKTGRYYDFKSGMPSTASTGAIAANIVYAQLQWFTGQPIDRIGTNITVAAAAGKLIRFGIATIGTDGLPDAVVLDTGSLAADVTGAVEATVALTPNAGWGWTLMHSDGAPTVTNYAIERMPAVLGWSSMTSTTLELAAAKNQTYGALPTSFGAISAYGSVAYRVAVRAA